MSELDERKRKRFKKKILSYAKRLEKTEPDLARRINERVDELVDWYAEHRRDMALEDFKKVLGVYA